MPVVSESKVLPETLTDTYRKLMKAGSGPGKTGRPKRAPRGRSPSRGKR